MIEVCYINFCIHYCVYFGNTVNITVYKVCLDHSSKHKTNYVKNNNTLLYTVPFNSYGDKI